MHFIVFLYFILAGIYIADYFFETLEIPASFYHSICFTIIAVTMRYIALPLLVLAISYLFIIEAIVKGKKHKNFSVFKEIKDINRISEKTRIRWNMQNDILNVAFCPNKKKKKFYVYCSDVDYISKIISEKYPQYSIKFSQKNKNNKIIEIYSKETDSPIFQATIVKK